MPKYRLYVEHDYDCERPDGEGSIGTMVSFNRRHINYQDPDTIDNDDVLATLSYYEHGYCKWMVGKSTVPDHGGWDTVEHAGVILWNGEDSEREWWDLLGQEKQDEVLDSIAETFTAWANGECYGYRLVEVSTCHACGEEHEEDVDSCFGFVGSKWFAEAVEDELRSQGIDAAKVDIAGEFGYVLEGAFS